MDNVKITDEVFESLLYISRLSIDAKEREKFSDQISGVVNYLHELDGFVQENLDYSNATNSEKDLRSSEIISDIQAKSLKRMSAEYMDGYFRVPKVLDN